MRLLFDALRALPQYQSLLDQIRSSGETPSLGLARAARLPLLAALHADLNRPILLVTDRADHALSLYDELGFWVKSPRHLFAEPNPLFYEEAAWGVSTRRERLQTLSALSAYHLPFAQKPETPPVIVASARSLMTRTLPRRDYLKACKKLSNGQGVKLEALLREWTRIGYQRVNIVLELGQFSHRGGLLDIWPVAESNPVRLDFFGDEIETIRRFDPATQRTIEKLESILVAPAREFLQPLETSSDKPSSASVRDSVNPLQSPFTAIRSSDSQSDTPSDSVRASVNPLQSPFTAIRLSDSQSDTPSASVRDSVNPLQSPFTEFHIPLLHPLPASLLDYFPQNAIVMLDDLSIIESMSNDIEEQAIKFRQESVEEGTLPSDYPIPYVTWSELADGMGGFASLDFGHSAESASSFGRGDKGEDVFLFGHDERFGGRLKPFIDYIHPIVERGEQVFIVSRQSPRLQELWLEHYPDPEYKNLQFIEASLSEGFTLLSAHLITDSEIFGWERPQPRVRQKQVAETPESIYADLQIGDRVVHIDHGIGRFNGLVQRILDGHQREFLAVEYQDGDTLFVPVHQADRLTRYVGAEGGSPSLDRLGGQAWHETKRRVKEAVQEVAEELLDLYARRQIVEGFSFNEDTAWQKELEDSFPYVETEDQIRALADIKRDMERSRPMDRLLCGDVGYGKTEVALRAAFKSVMSGKQVAVLVPTTVLAQQHYETFSQRLAAYPVKVEMLSRFRTPREQSEILLGLALGEVDIVIGTHRLISPDVQFKDLGLVVIDEEQRFGVTHKERLKKLRTEVDVLTLTATPIPRTLYMALTGVRDISNLNTPPEERLPIVTHVGPYSPKLVRQAILRELERGGQIFFVHNRVHTINAMRAHLNQLVPEARVDVGHGQMPEQQLANVMRRFNLGLIDVLLSTTIIESGLDIPNANTLIVDRADTFGLAQLYQLRGRVGRGAQRAYAYFFRHKKLLPTLEGQQRLEVIAENTQLGAGYSIAMRDLEIRGAGDLLGTRQHGYIQSIGFHLYTRLLADAVRRIRTNNEQRLDPSALQLSTFSLPLSMPVNVDLPLAVGIPSDYIADQDLRLRLYRRIADLRDETEVEAMASEFLDRFGTLPETVANLFYQMRVKLRAEKAGLVSINWENGQIVLRYSSPEEKKDAKRLPDLGPDVRGGKGAYWCAFGNESAWTKKLLQTLSSLAET